MFKFAQKDKEDVRLTSMDIEAYVKMSKSNHLSQAKLEKIGVGAKGIEEFKKAWKYR